MHVRLKSAAHAMRPIVRRRGWDLVHYPANNFAYLRAQQLRHLAVDLVIDVGANVGQYGRLLRSEGYGGKIVSYEPMSEAFEELSRAAASDDAWEVVRSALGARSGELGINISGNSISSSLLPMLDRHAEYAPRSVYIDSESVPIRRLDELCGESVAISSAPYLKIDTQGYESLVLKGAGELLNSFLAVELEMSLVPLYEGQELFPALLHRMMERGFRLAVLSSGMADAPRGETLQVDGIFVRA